MLPRYKRSFDKLRMTGGGKRESDAYLSEKKEHLSDRSGRGLKRGRVISAFDLPQRRERPRRAL